MIINFAWEVCCVIWQISMVIYHIPIYLLFETRNRCLIRFLRHSFQNTFMILSYNFLLTPQQLHSRMLKLYLEMRKDESTLMLSFAKELLWAHWVTITNIWLQSITVDYRRFCFLYFLQSFLSLTISFASPLITSNKGLSPPVVSLRWGLSQLTSPGSFWK